MRHLGLLLCAGACLIAGCASATDSPEPTEHARVQSNPIVGGLISNKHKEGVLINGNSPTGPFVCTGALVLNSTTVLTAKHCLLDETSGNQSTNIHVKAPYADAPNEASGASFLPHPTMDIAVLFLMQGIAMPPGVAFPTPALFPMADGTNVEVVGRIFNHKVMQTDLVMAPTTLSVLDATMYKGLEVLECGDSGGPVYAVDDPFHIVAINTEITNVVVVDGEATCVATNSSDSHYTRVDLASAALGFITNATPTSPGVRKLSGSLDEPATDCGEVTYAGVCNGEVLSYCDGGELATIDCGTQGGSCGPDETGMNCIYDTSSCGDVTYEGQCDGDVVQWCDTGLQEIDGAQYGMTCGYDAQDGFYDCI